jgi:tetratricopeptide (TPR) repeat protein
MPGVTGAVLVATAIAIAASAGPERAATRSRARPAATALATAGLLLLVVLTGRLVLADRWATHATDALADGRPAQALTDARKAEAVNPGLLRALYVQAAALARGDRYADARAVLLRAAARSPRDFVPHALLGDLAVRRGAPQVARAAYAAALRRNPRDPALAAAVRDLSSTKGGR